MKMRSCEILGGIGEVVGEYGVVLMTYKGKKGVSRGVCGATYGSAGLGL